MKLSYYHYYFKEKKRRQAPRVCHDIQPLLNAYLAYPDMDWKNQIKGDDEEQLLLLRTNNANVYMLVATRHQEIIKAINTQAMTCADLRERLEEDESAGFAAYFRCREDVLGLAATLRGPRTTALHRFVTEVIDRLGGSRWRFHLQPVGASLTFEQARGMAFVSRTSLKVGPENPVFQSLKELFAADSNDIGYFQITVAGKRNRNLKDVYEAIAAEADGEELERMTIRAKAVVDEALTDYFVETDGRLSDDIGTGTETELTRKLAETFAAHPSLHQHLQDLKDGQHYEEVDTPDLDRIGDIDHWRGHLRTDGAEAD